MCAYDRSSLGSAATAELACMHASSNRQLCSFSLVAGTGGTIALRGEIDVVDRESFVTALSRIDPPDDGDELVIDATELEFIDHNGLLAMTDVISRSGRRAVMRTRSSGPARLAEIMGLTRLLRVEVAL
jgi:anti-anti-sigma regulatory factor